MEGTKLTPELETLKTKLRSTWIAGDFGEIARLYPRGAEEFVKRLGIKPGMKVLDVACGTGNTALPEALLGGHVTGVDIAPNLLEQAKENAKREGLQIQFDEGDAEALPYSDSSFDVVVTMFGAMFAPRPELVASELKRVCRPGGSVAMGNWTPTGFVGQTFKLVASQVPPPPGMPSPVLWGVEETVRARLGDGFSQIETTPRPIIIAFPGSPAETVEHFKKYFGPTQKAFAALDAAGQAQLRHDLEQLWAKHNRVTDGSTAVESEYLEVIAVRA
jgi:SAM-dependent methyltransferase